MAYYNSYDWEEDYYTNRYSKNKKTGKSSYYNDDGYYKGGGYSSNWNWGNYGSYGLKEDDDKDLYIKNHESYFTPKDADFRQRINYSSDTKGNRDLIKEMSRFFYYKMLEDKEYYDDKYKDETRLNEQELAFHQQKKAYYDDLWDKDIPGYSPLEKSLFIFHKLEEQANENAKVGKPKQELSPEELQKAVQQIHVNREDYEDPIFNELLDMNEFSKKKKFKILDKIALIKSLGGEFKIEKETEEKVVSNSNIHAKKIMRDYSQIFNVELYQRLMPDFPIKLLTKNLIVNAPIDRTEHKQKIIFLLDYSG